MAVIPKLLTVMSALAPSRRTSSTRTGLGDQVREDTEYQKLEGRHLDVRRSDHLPNLDSIVLGYSLLREGLPRRLRGGQEPIHQPHHQLLHAQPRRLPGRPTCAARLYKDVLKAYSTVMDGARLPLPCSSPGWPNTVGAYRAEAQARPRGHRGGRIRSKPGRGRPAGVLRADDDQLRLRPRGREPHPGSPGPTAAPASSTSTSSARSIAG